MKVKLHEIFCEPIKRTQVEVYNAKVVYFEEVADTDAASCFELNNTFLKAAKNEVPKDFQKNIFAIFKKNFQHYEPYGIFILSQSTESEQSTESIWYNSNDTMTKLTNKINSLI